MRIAIVCTEHNAPAYPVGEFITTGAGRLIVGPDGGGGTDWFSTEFEIDQTNIMCSYPFNEPHSFELHVKEA